MTEIDKLRLWRCANRDCAKILGQVQRRSSGVRRLALWIEPNQPMKVIAYITGIWN